MQPQHFNFEINHKEILNLLTDILSFKAFSVQEEYLLYAKQQEKALRLVNLTTFQSSIFPAAKKTWFVAGGCRISHNKYFLTGGWDGTNHYSHSSIIDLSNNTEEVLANSSSERRVPGCICKEMKIFAFGGYDGTTFLITSEKFDLSTKMWSPLPNLPRRFYGSSAVINNKIVIVGRFLNFAYVFENNSYSKNAALISDMDYIACDQWIFSNETLYECENLEAMQWKQYNISRGNIPCIWIAHKKDQYIYFMADNYILWRIDTELKSAKKVDFTKS